MICWQDVDRVKAAGRGGSGEVDNARGGRRGDPQSRESH